MFSALLSPQEVPECTVHFAVGKEGEIWSHRGSSPWTRQPQHTKPWLLEYPPSLLMFFVVT